MPLRNRTELPSSLCAGGYSVGWGQRGWAAGQKHSHTSLGEEAEMLQAAMLSPAQVIQSRCAAGVGRQSHDSPSQPDPVPEPGRRWLRR